MRYLALAMNVDGTLATGGRADAAALAALARLRRTGRRAILVTSRRLVDLGQVFASLEPFDCVVAENGAILYWPSRRESTALCRPVPESFVRAMLQRGVTPLVRGQAVVQAPRARASAFVEAIGELGLELHVVFAGERVLAVPAGINKGAGLREALLSLGMSVHEVVSLGCGASDHSMLDVSECAVAVSNALPALKERAVFTTRDAAGAGVVELVDELVQHDLQASRAWTPKDVLTLGYDSAGERVGIPAYGENLLVLGPRGGEGASYMQGFLERLLQRGYQPCVIDCLGDFELRHDMVRLGSRRMVPTVAQVLAALTAPSVKPVVCLAALAPEARPGFFRELLRALEGMRLRTGRPHWLIIDGARHLWPAGTEAARRDVPKLRETLLRLEAPEAVARSLLEQMDVAVAVGPAPGRAIQRLATALDESAQHLPLSAGVEDGVLTWFLSEERWPLRLRAPARHAERLRQLPEHAEGDLGARSFIFRGHQGQGDARAHNLRAFCHHASRVADDTWLFHLWHGDISRWIRDVLHEDSLARQVAAIERRYELPAADSRREVCGVIAHHYALAA
ncbi:HAD hydrolase family protein [Pyxidicoccus parkwayensis]|uniref:HAD hydrolase family protein n=1 Tax=Pyxidicoccus parkwayensis TaxID=2813578 RepID=A0ABX7NMW7_9BACT|nr:HAD hydrolase family protein [Pyxidicoccus parkwaysis]QSQ19704.1 HAD hydrolase family protein [Pyxidicoccus parkwaysis]